MGAEEDCSALAIAAHEEAPPPSQVQFDATVQQRWSELETIHLIAAYQEKWYLLKRGQLKARHWEEIANNVFLRTGSDEPSKSSVQCRHKLEKLRKKYKIEKQLEEERGPGASSWPFFEHMDAMERGKSIAKLNSGASGNGNLSRTPRLRLKWHDNGDKDYKPPKGIRHCSDLSSPKMNGSLCGTGTISQPTDYTYMESPRVNLRPKVRKSYAIYEEDYASINDKKGFPDHNNVDLFSKRMKSELASVVRSLGEGLLRIERMKLEIQQDNERLRAEVELKRISMLLDSQKQMAGMVTKALTGKKSVKKRQLQEL
ncbi:hypothetical protein KP509_16G077000 [Ceratopteris richardii]|nr:hypothetical protein KP509_16G077000 [Ceratopteris richardii]KAH7388463.1 hypothetical protein KP509_16G077000 [Ceratopteris richardii]